MAMTPITAPIFPIIDENPYDVPLNRVIVTSAGIIPTVAPQNALNSSRKDTIVIIPAR